VTLDRFLADSVGPERFRSTLLGIYAALALLLSAMGVYGVTARSAAERTREMGVRLALGAAPRQIWRLVVGQAMGVVVAGACVGGVAASLSGVALTKVLPGLDGGAAWSALPAAIALSLAALLACVLPARRALRVDPVIVLRE
jgi:putative ABC transport system permease protein